MPIGIFGPSWGGPSLQLRPPHEQRAKSARGFLRSRTGRYYR
jgi:hypothetical protein